MIPKIKGIKRRDNSVFPNRSVEILTMVQKSGGAN